VPPVKTKESALYHPGALIQTVKNIYSSSATPSIEAEMIKEGTVGVLIQRHDDAYHWSIDFVGKTAPWWCNVSEIEPFYLNQTKK